jgi:hypothetical protein
LALYSKLFCACLLSSVLISPVSALASSDSELPEPSDRDHISLCEAECEMEITMNALDARKEKSQCLDTNSYLSGNDCNALFRASLQALNSAFEQCVSSCGDTAER